MRDNTDHLRRALDALEQESALTQRALARRLGISLGSANQLLRGLVERQWIRSVRTGAQTGYLVTLEGRDALGGMTREHLRRALASFSTVRDRVRDRLAACVTAADRADSSASVVLYGTGDVAEIAFACAADLGVHLVGFVEDEPRESYLGLPVRAPSELTSMALAGRPFDWLLVASLGEDEGIRSRLEALQFPLERVSWL